MSLNMRNGIARERGTALFTSAAAFHGATTYDVVTFFVVGS